MVNALAAMELFFWKQLTCSDGDNIGRVSVRCEKNHEIVRFSSAITNFKYVINLR